MNRLLLLLALILNFFAASALQVSQGVISGVVKNSSTSQHLAGVNIELGKEQGKPLSTLSDSAGRFTFTSLALGTYQLRLSSVGFKPRSILITLTPAIASVSLDTLTLEPLEKQLANVTVTAQKALVEDKGDRLVYNAEKDISNTGGSAADVLRKVPSLTVDLNGNVQLRGNGNIRVLVNGKPSAMMARNLADALRQMPASLIKSVEVITSPGARYDAEGAAGIINIITKKGLKGFNGNVEATTGNMNHSLGGSLSVRRKKIGFSFSGTGYRYRNINESSSLRKTLVNGAVLNELLQDTKGDNWGTGGYGELALDYDPDSTSHINFSANVWGGDNPNNSTAHNLLTDPTGAVLQQFRNESRFRNPYGNGQLDLGYTKTFKQQGREFALLGQYSRMPDNYFYKTARYVDDKVVFQEQSTNYSRNKEYTLQTDYTHPFTINSKRDTTTLKLETGAKMIIRDIGSEVSVAQAFNGWDTPIDQPQLANDFDYVQRVYSLYTALQVSNKRKWNLNGGLRLEQTDIDGTFKTTATRLHQQYTNLIPSINLMKRLEKSNIKLAYTQRITRPLVWYLNPWVNQADPKNISTGNPDLRPEINHGIELGYSLNGPKGLSVNSALYYRFTDNAIEYIAVVDSAGVSLSMPQNIATRKTTGWNVSVSTQAVKDLNLNTNFDIRYQDIQSGFAGRGNSGIVWNVNINGTYSLLKKYTLQGNLGYGSGWISLQGRNTGFLWYGVSGKREFWDKKASITLNVNNPLQRGWEVRFEQRDPSFVNEGRFYNVNRMVRLTFSWRFGQMSEGGAKQGKKIRNDDSGR